jgi:hypothetical protein
MKLFGKEKAPLFGSYIVKFIEIWVKHQKFAQNSVLYDFYTNEKVKISKIFHQMFFFILYLRRPVLEIYEILCVILIMLGIEKDF